MRRSRKRLRKPSTDSIHARFATQYKPARNPNRKTTFGSLRKSISIVRLPRTRAYTNFYLSITRLPPPRSSLAPILPLLLHRDSRPNREREKETTPCVCTTRSLSAFSSRNCRPKRGGNSQYGGIPCTSLPLPFYSSSLSAPRHLLAVAIFAAATRRSSKDYPRRRPMSHSVSPQARPQH